jgi:hypothetical protein
MRSMYIWHLSFADTSQSFASAAKFNRIITTYTPRLFVAFFYKDAKMDGVAFELGWLSHMYQSSGLTSNLRLLLEKGYQWEETTPYVPSLLPSVPSAEFDDSHKYSKASQLIHLFVRNLFQFK